MKNIRSLKNEKNSKNEEVSKNSKERRKLGNFEKFKNWKDMNKLKGSKVLKGFKTLPKNQMIIFVIALMLVAAGYLSFENEKASNLIPTSTLADAELMAGIGDATLVNANETDEKTQSNTSQNVSTSKEITNKSEEQNTIKENAIEENTAVKDNLQEQKENEESKSDDYFAQSRLDRSNMYSQMLENYQTILEAENITSEEKTNAQNQIQKMQNEQNAIMISENLIKTKGFEDIVLFMNNGNVTGVVKAEKLDEQQIAQIQNIITRELSVKVTNINISCMK